MRHVLIPILLFVCASGCAGQKKINISGTVTRDGKPLEWKSDNSFLLVLFAPVDRENNPDVFRAEADRETGSYKINGIPTGQYIVSIQQMDPAPGIDLLQYKFELGNSPIRKEVTSDGQVIDIDLPKDLPGGGKGGGGGGGEGRRRGKRNNEPKDEGEGDRKSEPD